MKTLYLKRSPVNLDEYYLAEWPMTSWEQKTSAYSPPEQKYFRLDGKLHDQTPAYFTSKYTAIKLAKEHGYNVEDLTHRA